MMPDDAGICWIYRDLLPWRSLCALGISLAIVSLERAWLRCAKCCEATVQWEGPGLG